MKRLRPPRSPSFSFRQKYFFLHKGVHKIIISSSIDVKIFNSMVTFHGHYIHHRHCPNQNVIINVILMHLVYLVNIVYVCVPSSS